ncbi:hypothetical protein [Neobacillus drentensis]|uniref:hypothetical protein n=1 Tax=Neobacillus drentensis TaxID=220684 RepID=UPI0030020B5F
MSNRFYDSQMEKNSKSFRFNNLNGLNIKGSGRSKIEIMGQLDHFTMKTLYENYDIIPQNLKVYPTIKVYPRGYQYEGGFEGFYHSETNHIDIIDHNY